MHGFCIFQCWYVTKLLSKLVVMQSYWYWLTTNVGLFVWPMYVLPAQGEVHKWRRQFNMKTPSNQYMDPHYKEETVVRPWITVIKTNRIPVCYLHNISVPCPYVPVHYKCKYIDNNERTWLANRLCAQERRKLGFGFWFYFESCKAA